MELGWWCTGLIREYEGEGDEWVVDLHCSLLMMESVSTQESFCRRLFKMVGGCDGGGKEGALGSLLRSSRSFLGLVSLAIPHSYPLKIENENHTRQPWSTVRLGSTHCQSLSSLHRYAPLLA